MGGDVSFLAAIVLDLINTCPYYRTRKVRSSRNSLLFIGRCDCKASQQRNHNGSIWCNYLTHCRLIIMSATDGSNPCSEYTEICTSELSATF